GIDRNGGTEVRGRFVEPSQLYQHISEFLPDVRVFGLRRGSGGEFIGGSGGTPPPAEGRLPVLKSGEGPPQERGAPARINPRWKNPDAARKRFRGIRACRVHGD